MDNGAVEIEPRPVAIQGTGDVTLRGDIWGPEDGPPVVLLPGGGQTRHSWRMTARQLGERGWQVWSMDQRGHGDSDWSPSANYSLSTFADDARAIVEATGAPAVAIGASLGGVSLLVASGEEPKAKVAALVLVDVAPRIEKSGSARITEFMTSHMEDGFATLEEASDAVAAYNPNRPRPRDFEGLKKNLRQRPDGRWIWHWDPRFRRMSDDETRVSSVPAERLEDAARALDMPVLLIRGRQSDLLSEEGARQFLTLVPHAEFVDVEGAGHMVAGDRNDAFNAGILAFLEKVRNKGHTQS